MVNTPGVLGTDDTTRKQFPILLSIPPPDGTFASEFLTNIVVKLPLSRFSPCTYSL
ncbi:MAG: hypothetical protein ACM3RX_09615 [Methanococcaceae archaeon]